MDKHFPGRMAEARGAAGISQVKAAEVSGVSRAMITRYETGESQPGVTLFLKLARLYGASPTWLLTGIPPKRWSPVEEAASQNEQIVQSFRLVASWMLKAADSGVDLVALVSPDDLATDRGDLVDGADTQEARPDDEIGEG